MDRRLSTDLLDQSIDDFFGSFPDGNFNNILKYIKYSNITKLNNIISSLNSDPYLIDFALIDKHKMKEFVMLIDNHRKLQNSINAREFIPKDTIEIKETKPTLKIKDLSKIKDRKILTFEFITKIFITYTNYKMDNNGYVPIEYFVNFPIFVDNNIDINEFLSITKELNLPYIQISPHNKYIKSTHETTTNLINKQNTWLINYIVNQKITIFTYLKHIHANKEIANIFHYDRFIDVLKQSNKIKFNKSKDMIMIKQFL